MTSSCCQTDSLTARKLRCQTISLWNPLLDVVRFRGASTPSKVWSLTGNTFLPVCLPDGDQKQSEGLPHTSSTCCRTSVLLLLLLHILPPLPRLSFQVHRSASGPLQLLGALPATFSSPRLPVTSGEPESAAPPVVLVEQQCRSLPGGALPCRTRRPPQRDECRFH